MFKKIAAVSLVIAILVFGVVAVNAQRGSANGSGPRGGRNLPGNSQASGIDPQTNANNYGATGFGYAQNRSRWNGQQRGQMNYGTGANGAGIGNSLPPASVEALPQEIVDLMIAGWLDEQHAYAVYESIMAQFGEVAPFVNIQQAENQHAAAWEFLFDRYGIPVPYLPASDMPTFASVEQACAQGAEAEIANFALYDEMLTAFEPYPDIYQVALALRNASEFNHLPAFQSCAGD
jgi:hypothetical protein